MENKNYESVYDSAVKDYISELIHRDMSQRTLKSYGDVARYFKEHKSETTKWDTAPSAADVRSWRDALLDRGTSKTTVIYYMKVLHGFFEYATDPELLDEQYFEVNPVHKKLFPVVKKSEESKPYTKVFDAEDLKKLWANKRISKEDKYWERNYAIVTLLLDGKVRNAELLDLKLNDIHFADDEDGFNYLVVNKGKGNKYREVDLNDISVTALRLYLKSGLRPAYATDDDYLFGTTAEKKFGCSKSGNEKWHRGSAQWLSKLVERHVKNVTGKSGFRTHSLRHNGSIMELNTGTPLEVIQAELGHSSVQTTHIYAGRLQSKRHRVNMAEVNAVRDEWAEKNKAMLEGA